jgi:hypothetical protein
MISSLTQINLNTNYKKFNSNQDYNFIQNINHSNLTLNKDYCDFSINKKNTENISRNKISFTGTDKFNKIMELRGLSCPSCGEIMIAGSEAAEFAEFMAKATGDDLITGLNRYRKRLPKTEQDVIDRLKIAITILKNSRNKEINNENSPINLKKALDYLVNNKVELTKNYDRPAFHINYKKKSKKTEFLPALQSLKFKEITILSQIHRLVCNLESNIRETLLLDVESAIKVVEVGKNDHPFQRKIFLNYLHNLPEPENSKNDLYILREIKSIAGELPSSTTDADAFIVKHSRSSLEDAAIGLIHTRTMTKDHINPKANGGINDPENLLAECYLCNHKKGNRSLYTQVKNNPAMKEHVQEYINNIMYRIIDKKLTDFDDYPEKLRDVLFIQSKKLIKINISMLNVFSKNRRNEQFDVQVQNVMLQVSESYK